MTRVCDVSAIIFRLAANMGVVVKTPKTLQQRRCQERRLELPTAVLEQRPPKIIVLVGYII